jgi:hypothetical protein
MEKTYKIPEGSEEKVDEMVAVAVERFLRDQMKETPVEEKQDYQEAVNSFRIENNMNPKYTIVKIEPILDDTKNL